MGKFPKIFSRKIKVENITIEKGFKKRYRSDTVNNINLKDFGI